MASAKIKKLTDYLLTCPVCAEVFTDPGTLNCQHIFCRACLTKFTKSKPEALKVGYIPCPLCRQSTPVPDRSKPVDHWVSQLKPNLIILNLIDALTSDTHDADNPCGLCLEKGDSVAASSWCPDCDITLCQGCVRGHRRLPATSDHPLEDLSQMVKARKKYRILCKEHKTERMELLCKTCSKLACQKCCVLYHRKCPSVSTITSLVPEFNEVLSKTKKMMMLKVNEDNARLQNKKSQIEEIRRNERHYGHEIRTSSQGIVDRVRKKEEQLLDKLHRTTEEQVEEVKADMNSLRIAVQMNQQHSEVIEQTLKSETEMDMCRMFLWCQTGDATMDQEKDIFRYRPAPKINFGHPLEKLNQEIEKLLDETDIVVKGSPLPDFRLQEVFNINMGKETGVDIAVLTVQGITTQVVTTYSNESVMSFYKRNARRCQSKLDLARCPWGVTKLTHSQVAVTVPYPNQIVIIDVTPDLLHSATINTSKTYDGLAVLQPSLLVACSGKLSCVDILDMQGIILESFSGTGRLSSISSPFYLCVSDTGTILVSCVKSKSVLCITPSGSVVFSYTGTGERVLTSPGGITTTSIGDILVADKDTHKVIQLTAAGQYSRDLLTTADGIEKPLGLCMDRQDMLHVTLTNGLIRVYQFSE